jgi:glycine/D-amino acid oxidase-like deaminating enzyme
VDHLPTEPVNAPLPVGQPPVSFWWASLGGRPAPRPPLPGDLACDVAIVGGGYTGLWTAYYLARQDPALRIAVLEARYVGYGASGRNGGWLSGQIAAPAARLSQRGDPSGAARLRQAMIDSVDEVLKVIAAEGIQADAVKSGCLRVAVTPAQEARLWSYVAAERALGSTAQDWQILDAAELDARVRVSGARAAAYTPHCARVHPARLVAGLAAASQQRGVTIYEDTPVTAIGPATVRTARGPVRAPVVVRATEGFTARLPRQARRWLPMNSSMIVTEPLPATVWETIGWEQAETLSDMAHAYVYLQRTADDRIAIGGRGNPYVFGNGFDPAGRTPPETAESLASILRGLFPAAAGARIEQSWSGVLAVPRDWCAGVGYDRATGFGWAGGYVGQGVTTANLAGRTLAHLITGTDSALTSLPWVGHVSRRWEPEPLRWLGVQAMYAAYRMADRREQTYGLPRSAIVARVADRLSGR